MLSRRIYTLNSAVKAESEGPTREEAGNRMDAQHTRVEIESPGIHCVVEEQGPDGNGVSKDGLEDDRSAGLFVGCRVGAVS